MSKKPPVGATIAVSYGAVIAFAAVYFIGGLLLDKLDKKKSSRDR